MSILPYPLEQRVDRLLDIEELSEEDQQLKSELEMLVERLKVCSFLLLCRVSLTLMLRC